MRYKIIVECTKKQKRKHKRRLHRCHVKFSYKQNGIYYFSGNLSERKLKLLQQYCKEHYLRYRIDNDFSERSSSYRDVFFKSYQPILGRFYFCSYCGKILTHKRVTVDHLYPVGGARCDVTLQKKLIRKGITNINDKKNLVAACDRCNKKKGKKLGRWILRGEIGRHKWYWFLMHLLRCIFVLAIFCLVYYMCSAANIFHLIPIARLEHLL